MRIVGPAAPCILFQMIEGLLDATDAGSDAGPW